MINKTNESFAVTELTRVPGVQMEVIDVLKFRRRNMNQYDVSGILMTYSTRARHAQDKEHLKDIIRELKQELDLRKIEKNINR